MKLGLCLKRYRLFGDIGLRDLALEIGVSAATISRIENSNFKPDLVTFNKILNWLIKD